MHMPFRYALATKPRSSGRRCHSDVITVGGWSWFGDGHHVENSLKVVHRAELHHDLPFAFAKADRHPGVEGSREALGDVLEAGHLDRLATRGRRRPRPSPVGQRELLL